MFTHGYNKLTAWVSGRISDLLNVYCELRDPNVLDQPGYRFQFQNQSERSTQKYTSYVCVSEKGAVACTCSCPSHQTEWRMRRETPENYAKFALGPQDGALSDVSVVSPFKCCHQASNLEYLKRCVMNREQVPRLVKAT